MTRNNLFLCIFSFILFSSDVMGFSKMPFSKISGHKPTQKLLLKPLRALQIENSGKQKKLNDDDDGYLRISRNNDIDAVDLQTKVLKMKKQINPGADSHEIKVDLVSILHIADAEFYKEVEQLSSGYDRVLYEMIVDKDNIFESEDGRKKINTHLYPTQEQVLLAEQYGLCTQLEGMSYLDKRNWFLADLDRDSILSLQGERGEKRLGSSALAGNLKEFSQAVFQGRAPEGQILPSFFLPGQRWGLLLRLLLWLTPCPEMEVILLDWARTYPRAGTISDAASLMLDALFFGNIKTAKKLAFAQMLVSSQMDGGSSWGKATSVIVEERNKEVVKEVERAVADGCSNIAVLYGGLHMQDLDMQLRRKGFYRSKSSWSVAWRMPFPKNELYEKFAPALKLTLVPLYIALGSWDWVDTIVGTTKELVEGDYGAATSIIALYLLRHIYLYFGLAKYLVRWDKKLF